MQYPDNIEKMVEVFRKLPGIGLKSAQRFAFHLLDCPCNELEKSLEVLKDSKAKLHHCQSCGAIFEKHCSFCDNPTRDHSQLCIVAYPKEVFAFEQTKEYRGIYYVLGCLLSPLNGFIDEDLNLAPLAALLEKGGIKEVIIALDATVEGEATSLYLKQELAPYGVLISRVAFGLPLGASLEYADGGTLAKALEGRGSF